MISIEPLTKDSLSVWRKIPFSKRVEPAILYSIFFMTGAAVVLPGVLLPLLSRQWRLSDGAAGLFFLCFSAGSSAGSLLAKGRLSYALALGCALVGSGELLLSASHAGAPLLVISLYGCGLGLSMTSISLLRSRRWPGRRIAEFARLNLVWALGAGTGPAVLLRTASRFGTGPVLQATGTIFFLFAVLVVLTVTPVQSQQESAGNWLRSIRAVPPILLCLIPLTTGVESGMSSWLSSYIMRGGYVLSVTIGATTMLGAGIILSRIFYSHRAAGAAPARLVICLHSMLIVLGIVALMLSTSPLVSIPAAFLTGLGVGPMYPFVLALLLGHHEAGNVGFLAGGLGASVIPMIVGVVAGWAHSLRVGLAVPLAAASLMFVLGAQLQRQSQRQPVAPGSLAG